MRPIHKTAITMFLAALSGCFSGSRQTLESVEFENAQFGLEYIPDHSLEGYNKTYYVFFQPAGGSKHLYISKPEDGFAFANFPKDVSILKGHSAAIVDTVKRTVDGYGPDEALTTLYVDPRIIDAKSFDTFKRFVLQNFHKPDKDNQLLFWLNKAYNQKSETTRHYLETIYAVVYAGLPSLEPVYASPDGKDSIKVGVDKMIWFKDATDTPPAWMNAGNLKDSTFFYWKEHEGKARHFGEYVSGPKKFNLLYKTAQVQN